MEVAVVVAVFALPKENPVGAAGVDGAVLPKLNELPTCPVLPPRLNPGCVVEAPKLNPAAVVVWFGSVLPNEKPVGAAVVAATVVVLAGAFPNVNPPGPNEDCVVPPKFCFGAANPNENPVKDVGCAPNAEAAVVPEEEVVLDMLNNPVD